MLSNLKNTIAIGNEATVTFDNQIRMGNGNIIQADIQVAWNVTSDKRWKENIKAVPLGLDFIKDLNPVSYHRKNNENQDIEFGLIAQELEVTLKKYGFTQDQLGLLHKGTDGYYSVRYNDLIAPLIKAVQEQQNMIHNQEATINTILARLENIEKKALVSSISSK